MCISVACFFDYCPTYHTYFKLDNAPIMHSCTLYTSNYWKILNYSVYYLNISFLKYYLIIISFNVFRIVNNKTCSELFLGSKQEDIRCIIEILCLLTLHSKDFKIGFISFFSWLKQPLCICISISILYRYICEQNIGVDWMYPFWYKHLSKT